MGLKESSGCQDLMLSGRIPKDRVLEMKTEFAK